MCIAVSNISPEDRLKIVEGVSLFVDYIVNGRTGTEYNKMDIYGNVHDTI